MIGTSFSGARAVGPPAGRRARRSWADRPGPTSGRQPQASLVACQSQGGVSGAPAPAVKGKHGRPGPPPGRPQPTPEPRAGQVRGPIASGTEGCVITRRRPVAEKTATGTPHGRAVGWGGPQAPVGPRHRQVDDLGLLGESHEP